MADHYQTGTETDSTEDMVASIDEFNDMNNDGNMIIISMDVKALYPSLDVKEVAKTVAQIYRDSSFEIQGVNWEEACKYLAILLTPEEIESHGLKEVIHQRKHKRGRPPGITTPEVRQRVHQTAKEEDSIFKKPSRSLSKQEEKEVMAKCLELMILATMNNHTYTFDNSIRLQAKGGAIGLKVTQALARLYMLWWDREFLDVAKRAGAEIKMYKRYVDDTNITMKALDPYIEWNEDSRKKRANTTSEGEEAADVRSAKEVRRMANSIAECIQWEEAVPSTSPGGRLPILDLQCWHSNTSSNVTTIYYMFYRKPMANRQLMLFNSAMPEQMKRTTLSQEFIRILRNCHPDLPWEEKLVHLNEFTERLRDSGYPEKMRAEIVQSELKGYSNMKETERSGGRPVNRMRTLDGYERRKQRERKRQNWYKSDKYATVLFVPCTPRSILANRLREVEVRGREDRKWRVKIVEKGGQTVKSQLCKSDPWAGGTCGKATCFPCQKSGGGNCKRKNVGYCITCEECGAEYHGETSRNMFSRGEEHLRALSNKTRESVLWNHCLNDHNGEQAAFTMKACGYFSEPLSRQIHEAVRIHNAVNIMNRRGEWKKTAVSQAHFIRD